MTEQLVLGVKPFDDTSFDTYVDPTEGKLLYYLRELLQPECLERFIYIWGETGLGKTHLLNAVTNQAVDKNIVVSYFDCAELVEYPTELIDGLAEQDLVVLDNVHQVSGYLQWQKAMFNLYNQIRDNGRTRLLVASNVSPAQLQLELADLKSRLAWGVSFRLLSLNEQMKKEFLQRRAAMRGFELSSQMIDYILTHHGRDQHSLMTLLNKLDIASLQAQRKITIPFIREILRNT